MLRASYGDSQRGSLRTVDFPAQCLSMANAKSFHVLVDLKDAIILNISMLDIAVSGTF
jgi:hypothetical protein